jgi:hypothetical protein
MKMKLLINFRDFPLMLKFDASSFEEASKLTRNFLSNNNSVVEILLFSDTLKYNITYNGKIYKYCTTDCVYNPLNLG